MNKIDNSIYDVANQQWNKKSIAFNESNIRLQEANISNYKLDKFVNELDIGVLHSIPGYCGVTRNLSDLIYMIADLHLTTEGLRNQLIWFDENDQHFIFEFSDDGAPESREETMSIGSITLWNLGGRVRSREYYYPLHMISCGEKDIVVEELWRTHSEAMILLEGNTFNVNGKKITMEFQPSADQAWQFWANNVLTQSATYPSMFANVHKNELKYIGGNIGPKESDKWHPPTMDSRKSELIKLNKFLERLPTHLNEKQIHERKLKFMAEHGLRQLGEPRIGVFADRQRPEPLHLEINNWQHIMDLIYVQYKMRGSVDILVSTLRNSASEGGLGLKGLSREIEDHYKNEKA